MKNGRLDVSESALLGHDSKLVGSSFSDPGDAPEDGCQDAYYFMLLRRKEVEHLMLELHGGNSVGCISGCVGI